MMRGVVSLSLGNQTCRQRANESLPPTLRRFVRSTLRCYRRLKSVVMLLDPSNFDGLFCSAAGIKIDFSESLGQDDKC
jgi:hypothetical protein